MRKREKIFRPQSSISERQGEKEIMESQRAEQKKDLIIERK